MKTVILTILIVFLLTGCKENNEEAKFNLDNKYYNKAELVSINGEELKELENNNGNFIVFVYMPRCNASALFYTVVREFSNIHGITIYRVQFSRIEGSRMADSIRFFPTAVIYNDGEVATYLDANKNEHIDYYRTSEGFKNWLTKYIYITN